MNNKMFLLFLALTTSTFAVGIGKTLQQKDKNKDKASKIAETKAKEAKALEIKESEKTATAIKRIPQKENNYNSTQTDSLELFLSNSKLKFLKKKAHASYYHNRFNGRRTASGKKFSNNAYTAAHKKLPFGTKVKVTNESNGNG